MTAKSHQPESYQALTREQMAWRAAQDLPEGAYVNLGIGIPTLAASFVPPGREVIFHSENGILGMGPKPEPGKEDPYMVDAGKTTLVPGGCFVHHADAFLMIRGGHLDVSLLGAFEVSEKGDLANWTTEDPAFPPGIGGAMISRSAPGKSASSWNIPARRANRASLKLAPIRSPRPAASSAFTPTSRRSM
jgi:3-oxoadipate CoA-transferase beta subunit